MLSIVIVNWNTRDLLRQCLDSIKTHLKEIEGLEVVVVDNASKDKSSQMVTSLFPWVKLISNDVNTGFATACNQGANLTTGKVIAFINPDVIFESSSILELLEFLETQPNVGIVAPKLLYPDGRLQPSVRRFPTPWIMFLLLSKLSRFANRLTSWKRYTYANFDYEQMRSVEQVMGAALFIKRNVFDEVGKFDSSFFIWFEEVDLCKRVKEHGYLVFFIPQVYVYHAKSKAFTQQSILLRQQNFSKSARWYASKHFSNSSYVFIWIISWLSILPALLLTPVQQRIKKYQATEK